MATFRDNKQALYKIFQYALTIPNPPQKHHCHWKKYHRIATQQAKSDTIQKGMLFSPNSDYTYFSYNLTIRSSKSFQIPDIRVFFKIISGHKF